MRMQHIGGHRALVLRLPEATTTYSSPASRHAHADSSPSFTQPRPTPSTPTSHPTVNSSHRITAPLTLRLKGATVLGPAYGHPRPTAGAAGRGPRRPGRA